MVLRQVHADVQTAPFHRYSCANQQDLIADARQAIGKLLLAHFNCNWYVVGKDSN